MGNENNQEYVFSLAVVIISTTVKPKNEQIEWNKWDSKYKTGHVGF